MSKLTASLILDPRALRRSADNEHASPKWPARGAGGMCSLCPPIYEFIVSTLSRSLLLFLPKIIAAVPAMN